MKNIETILSDAGIELTDDQKKAVTSAVAENYKPISDWQNQVTKVKTLEETLETTKESLKKFDGVDVEGLKNQITTLQSDLETKEKEYQEQIDSRDFMDDVERAIRDAKGKNIKAITALLDVETLKASKNRKDDIASSIKALTEAEDSKMLFGDSEGNPVGTGNPIGNIGTGNKEDADMAQMRAIMGLPAKEDGGK